MAVDTQPIPRSAVTAERDQVAARYGLVTAVMLAREARITYRQLDYWTRAGLLISDLPGSGFSRLYEEPEVDVARALGALSAAGIAINGRFGRATVEHVREHGLSGTVRDPETGALAIDLDWIRATYAG